MIGPQLSWELDGDPSAAEEARRAVAEALRGWDASEWLAEASTVAADLVREAGAPVTLVLMLADDRSAVLLEVRDADGKAMTRTLRGS